MDGQDTGSQITENLDVSNRNPAHEADIYISSPSGVKIPSQILEKLTESDITPDPNLDLQTHPTPDPLLHSGLITDSNFLTANPTSIDPNNFSNSAGQFNTHHLQKFNTNIPPNPSPSPSQPSYTPGSKNHSASISSPKLFKTNYQELLEKYKEKLQPFPLSDPADPKTLNFPLPAPHHLLTTNFNSLGDFLTQKSNPGQ
jgi:hypothetical protein